MSWLLSVLLRFASSGLVDRTLSYLERRHAEETGREKLRTQVEIETIRAAVSETRILAELQRSKMDHWVYWFFVALFLAPLGLWWAAVIADSIGGFTWNVAALPHPLDEWAADMVRWIFFTGGAAATIRALR